MPFERPANLKQLLRAARKVDVHRAPFHASEKLAARVLAAFVFETGLLVLVTTLDVSGVTSGELRRLHTGSVAGLVVGLGIWCGWRWLPGWFVHVGLAGQTAATLDLIVQTDRAAISGAYLTLFVFALAYAGFFFSWVGVVAHLAWVLLASAIALHELGMPPSGIVLVLNEFTLVTLAIAILTRRGDKAQLDSLTHLPNRRALDRRAAAAIREATPSEPLGLLLIDIDHFKVINDTDGHAAGDALLVECARKWSRIAPSSAMIARLGGDEFCAVLPGWPLDEARDLAERLSAVVPQPATASVGVAMWQQGDSLTHLMARADAALYDAKRAGRARVVVRGVA